MTSRSPIDPEIKRILSELYAEMMWLARRPNVTPSMARAWYTHVAAHRLKRRLRRFSGKVSRAALRDPAGVLRLEHYARIQATLTRLVESHLKRRRRSALEFIRTVLRCEQVHIVTFRENYDAMIHDGDYRQAGITLVPWRSISLSKRRVLWRRMLRGKVENSAEFRPDPS